MNGRSEKGLIAVAVAFLVIVSAMSLLQMIPTDEDVEEGGAEVQQYTETPAFDRIISNNYEPESVEDELDPDGDGEPDHDNDILQEAGSVDVEELLDEDGDGEPDYAVIAEPGTPLGTAIESTEGMDMLDYEMEDIEDLLDETNESVEGDLVVDEDAEEIVEYDPEEDAGVYDEDVVETGEIEEFHVLWGEGETDDAKADPDYEKEEDGKGYAQFTTELAEYDNDTTDTEEYNESTGWSRQIFWTYDAIDADNDGNPEHESAVLLIVWSYDGDDDGNAEFTWLFLAGYEGYDNNSNGVAEYEAVLVVGMRMWDINSDGVKGRIVEWNWGRVTVNEDEDLVNEETLIFAAYRTVTGEANRIVKVTKWGKHTVDADDDTINEKESTLFIHKEFVIVGNETKFAKHHIWAMEEIDSNDDRRLDEYRAVVIVHIWYDNNTDGNPEFVRGFVGGVEEIFTTNLSVRVLVMTSVGIDSDGDGNQEMNRTYLWWHQTDYDERDGDAMYGRIGILAAEYYDNNTNGNPEYVSTKAGAVEYWDADMDGNMERNRTGAVGETLTDADDDGNPETNERFVWVYENGDDNDDGDPNHVIAAEAREYVYDNDSSGEPEYMFLEAGGYEAWDNDTNGVPEYEALFRIENRTWANHTDGQWDGYRNTMFAIYIEDADEDGNPERGAGAAALDQGVDQNDDGYIDRAWGTRAVMVVADGDSDGNFNYTGIFFGSYDFEIKGTDEYQQTEESEEARSDIEALLDSNGDGEPDQDQGTITEFVDEELQDEVDELFDGDGDETPDFSVIGDEPISKLGTGGDDLLNFEPLDLNDVNDALQNESEGTPATDHLYNDSTKQDHGMGEELWNATQPEVNYEQAVIIDELDLDQKILWWEGEEIGSADEEWLTVGLMAQGHELWDNNSNGIAEEQAGYNYTIYLEGVGDDGSARHRQAKLDSARIVDTDEDGVPNEITGASGYLETWDNDTDGEDEYQAAIWIGVHLVDADGDGNPEINQTLIAGVEQEFYTDDHENPYHVRAVIGFANVSDEDSDGNPEYVQGIAGAMEMYDNDTDGNPDYLAVFIFGIEQIDADSDGNPEVNRTFIWILEVTDVDSDGNHERLRAVIVYMENWDNDTDGVVDETNAMSAGCVKIDEDDDGNDERVTIYVAGGSETAEGTEWFLWFHEAIDDDDDGEIDATMSFALYMLNHTDEQTTVTAVHTVEDDRETLFFGVGTSVDANEDGNKESEEAAIWYLESDGSTGVSRGVLVHFTKNDSNDDGNTETETTTIIGFQSEDDDLDGTPERQTMFINRFMTYDNNSDGNNDYSVAGGIGARVEGNGTNPEYGYLYYIYAQAWDNDSNGTEDNTTTVLGGYEFYDNDTDGNKNYEAVLILLIDWDDDDLNGKQDEGETDYTRFGAKVDRS